MIFALAPQVVYDDPSATAKGHVLSLVRICQFVLDEDSERSRSRTESTTASETSWRPEKIATDGERIFGMSWAIFSRREIEQFVAMAGTKGLKPYGQMNFTAGDRPISCFDRDYTFAWMVLQKQ